MDIGGCCNEADNGGGGYLDAPKKE